MELPRAMVFEETVEFGKKDMSSPDSGKSLAQTEYFKTSIFWFYGLASAAFGIINLAFVYMQLIYSNQVLGLPGHLCSKALALATIWDGVSDLFFGHMSDKTESSMGRRHPYMYVSLLILPPSFFALFHPVVELTDDNTFAYVLVTSVVVRLGSTLFEMPSIAQLPELEHNYDRRNKWLACRYAFSWYGGLVMHISNFFFWVGTYGTGVQTGYTFFVSVAAPSIFFIILTSSLGTHRAASGSPPTSTTPVSGELLREFQQVARSLSNHNFRALFLYGLFAGISDGLTQALYLYNTEYFFFFSGREIGFIAVGLSPAPAIGYYVVPWLGRWHGKRNGAICAVLAQILLLPLPYVLLLIGWWPELESLWSFSIFTTYNLMLAVCQYTVGVLLDSMMADVVEDSEIQTEQRSEGLFFAARGFVQKLVSAGGIMCAGEIVSAVGLDGISKATAMTWEMRQKLALFYLPVSSVLSLLSALFVSWYDIDRAKHDANLTSLSHRRTLHEGVPLRDLIETSLPSCDDQITQVGQVVGRIQI